MIAAAPLTTPAALLATNMIDDPGDHQRDHADHRHS